MSRPAEQKGDMNCHDSTPSPQDSFTIPIVHNTAGIPTPFSIDRFARTHVASGLDLDSARALGRQLLNDLQQTHTAEVTTDGIRHWLAERDPLIFVARRSLFQVSSTGRRTYFDPRLCKIVQISEQIAGGLGLLLHDLHLNYFRPGGGIMAQEGVDDEEEDEIPPFPEEGETDPLEEPYGQDADHIRLITPEELDQLREGTDLDLGTKPEEPDFTKSGKIGSDVFFDNLYEWTIFRRIDGLEDYRGQGREVRLECGTIWLLYVMFIRDVPDCEGLNFAHDYRAALLRAFAEAFRICRTHSRMCPNAKLWMLYTRWGCDPSVFVFSQFAVTCVAP